MINMTESKNIIFSGFVMAIVLSLTFITNIPSGEAEELNNLPPYLRILVKNFDRIVDYCFAHADRVAAGENVVQDLIKAGLLNQSYAETTCENAQNASESFKSINNKLDELNSQLGQPYFNYPNK